MVRRPERRPPRILGTTATVLWYAAVLLPVRPPWQHREATAAHRRLRILARLMIGCLTATAISATGAGAATYAAFRALRNLPISLAAAGWGIAHGGRPELRGGLLVISTMHGGFGPRAGLTVGSVYLTQHLTAPLTLRHEQHHAGQWAVLGPALFVVGYAGAEAAGDVLLHAGRSGSVFEMAAGLHDGGYAVPRHGLARLLDRALEPHRRPRRSPDWTPPPAIEDSRPAPAATGPGLLPALAAVST